MMFRVYWSLIGAWGGWEWRSKVATLREVCMRSAAPAQRTVEDSPRACPQSWDAVHDPIPYLEGIGGGGGEGYQRRRSLVEWVWSRQDPQDPYGALAARAFTFRSWDVARVPNQYVC